MRASEGRRQSDMPSGQQAGRPAALPTKACSKSSQAPRGAPRRTPAVLHWQPASRAKQRLLSVLLQCAGEGLQRAVQVEHPGGALGGPGQHEHVVVLGGGTGGEGLRHPVDMRTVNAKQERDQGLPCRLRMGMLLCFGAQRARAHPHHRRVWVRSSSLPPQRHLQRAAQRAHLLLLFSNTASCLSTPSPTSSCQKAAPRPLHRLGVVGNEHCEQLHAAPMAALQAACQQPNVLLAVARLYQERSRIACCVGTTWSSHASTT